MPEKEREAYLSLKQNKILEDKKQEPAIRVALRSIKDFAFPIKKDEEIFWRIHSTTEQEERSILEPKTEEKKIEEKIVEKEEKKESEELEKTKEEVEEKPVKKEEVKEKQEENKQEEKKDQQETLPEPKPLKLPLGKPLDIGLKIAKRERIEKPKSLKKQELQEKFENPLVIKEEVKKEKPKSPFVTDIIEKISKKYLIVEEKYHKPKEYSCIVQINSELGPINFLAFANDKKKLSETDLRKMLSEAQKMPLPALVLHKGEVSRKAIDYSKTYFSVLKIEKI